jgi:hypothetical protein
MNSRPETGPKLVHDPGRDRTDDLRIKRSAVDSAPERTGPPRNDLASPPKDAEGPETGPKMRARWSVSGPVIRRALGACSAVLRAALVASPRDAVYADRRCLDSAVWRVLA